MSDSVLRDMNGATVVITPEQWHNYLKTHGYTQSDLNEILRRGEQIPLVQLDTDRRARLIKFLRGVVAFSARFI